MSSPGNKLEFDKVVEFLKNQFHLNENDNKLLEGRIKLEMKEIVRALWTSKEALTECLAKKRNQIEAQDAFKEAYRKSLLNSVRNVSSMDTILKNVSGNEYSPKSLYQLKFFSHVLSNMCSYIEAIKSVGLDKKIFKENTGKTTLNHISSFKSIQGVTAKLLAIQEKKLDQAKGLFTLNCPSGTMEDILRHPKTEEMTKLKNDVDLYEFLLKMLQYLAHLCQVEQIFKIALQINNEEMVEMIVAENPEFIHHPKWVEPKWCLEGIDQKNTQESFYDKHGCVFTPKEYAEHLNTPIAMAIAYNHPAMVRLLLQKGLDLKGKDNHQVPTLVELIFSNIYITPGTQDPARVPNQVQEACEILTLLIEAGIDPEVGGTNSLMARNLHYANKCNVPLDSNRAQYVMKVFQDAKMQKLISSDIASNEVLAGSIGLVVLTAAFLNTRKKPNTAERNGNALSSNDNISTTTSVSSPLILSSVTTETLSTEGKENMQHKNTLTK